APSLLRPGFELLKALPELRILASQLLKLVAQLAHVLARRGALAKRRHHLPRGAYTPAIELPINHRFDTRDEPVVVEGPQRIHRGDPHAEVRVIEERRDLVAQRLLAVLEELTQPRERADSCRAR